MSRQNRLGAAAILVLAAVLSCQDQDTLAPVDPISGGLSFRPSLTSGQSGGGTIGISNIYNPNDSLALPTYSSSTVVKVTVSGTTVQKWNVVSGTTPPHYPGDVNGTYDARGAYFAGWCPYSVMIYYNGGNNFPPPGCSYGGPVTPPQSSYEWYLTVSGAGVARRGGAPQYQCSGQPCYYYEGEVEVQVDWVPAELKLVASKRAITPNQQVTFTASAVPGTVANRTIPLVIQRWRWKPDSGQEVVVVCAAVCNRNPSVSGTMTVDALVNGVAATQSVHVTVFPCLTGDSIMDNPEVRKGLREAWDSTGYPGPSTQRHERGGGLHCDVNNVCTPTLYPFNSATDNACNFVFPGAAGGGSIYWHMHPFRPLDPTDSLPSPPYCPYQNGPPPPGRVRVAAPYPSAHDLAAAAGFPHVVVDPDNGYLIPGGLFPPQPKDVRTFPRSSCDVLAPPII